MEARQVQVDMLQGHLDRCRASIQKLEKSEVLTSWENGCETECVERNCQAGSKLQYHLGSQNFT